jgi:signal transduction histidine kinase
MANGFWTFPRDRQSYSGPAAGGGAGVTFLHGGGEMGARIRDKDWSQTPLGPPGGWPRSLKTAVRIMLTSRQPMFVWWGDELRSLYNDAYMQIAGGKHPDLLGQPAFVAWRDTWDRMRPHAEWALRTNEGTCDESLPLIMERSGYPEETYYTFSYNPVPDDDGGPGGILCTNTDETQRIIGERRLALLRELAAGAAAARTFEEACELSARCLQRDPHDLPFALIHLVDPDRRRARLAGLAGIGRDHPLAAQVIAFDDPDGVWPFSDVLRTHAPCLVDLQAMFSGRRVAPDLPRGAWPRAPTHAVAAPIVVSGPPGQAAVLVAGLNPFRAYDEDYRRFLDLVSAQIAAGFANAHAHAHTGVRAFASGSGKANDEAARAPGRGDALRLDRMKDEFLATLSHELRTPVNAILGWARLLTHEGSLDAVETRKGLLAIERNARVQTRLIEDLLDMSRILGGRIRLDVRRVLLPEVIEEAVQSLRAAADARRTRLVVIIDPDPGSDSDPDAGAGAVSGDPDRLRQVFWHLLSNAIKFTPSGGAVEVRLTRHGGIVEVAVADDGEGVAAAFLPYVFESFRQEDASTTRRHAGLGLGLSIVKLLVELHGGSVRAASAGPGLGATFVVTLPLLVI